MAAQSPGVKPAFETNNVILPYRASDRHRRLRRLLHWWGRPETGKGTMHLDN